MKLALAALLLLSSALPAVAGGPVTGYRSRGGWAEEEKCYRKEYREEYVPGTSKSPGYVKTYRERVEVPCERKPHTHYVPSAPPNLGHTKGNVDDNSCVEGSIIGGILGGAAGGTLATKKNWIWSIPAGVVGGAMVGCQVDGG